MCDLSASPASLSRIFSLSSSSCTIPAICCKEIPVPALTSVLGDPQYFLLDLVSSLSRVLLDLVSFLSKVLLHLVSCLSRVVLDLVSCLSRVLLDFCTLLV